MPLSLRLFRPELLHVLNTLDGAAVAVLVCVFCVCLYVTLVTSDLCVWLARVPARLVEIYFRVFSDIP